MTRSEATIARGLLRDLKRAVADPAPLPRRWRRALMCCLALLPLAGCAALRRVEPDSASVVLAHVSHISQHAPICTWTGERCTNFGFQTASLAGRWRAGRWWWSVGDGIQLPGGDLSGPHEVFTAQVGYTLWRKH